MIHTDSTVTTQINDCHLVAQAATAGERRRLGTLEPVIALRVEGHTRQLLEVVTLRDRLTAHDLNAVSEAIHGPTVIDETGRRSDEHQCAVREMVERVVATFAIYFPQAT